MTVSSSSAEASFQLNSKSSQEKRTQSRYLRSIMFIMGIGNMWDGEWRNVTSINVYAQRGLYRGGETMERKVIYWNQSQQDTTTAEMIREVNSCFSPVFTLWSPCRQIVQEVRGHWSQENSTAWLERNGLRSHRQWSRLASWNGYPDQKSKCLKEHGQFSPSSLLLRRQDVMGKKVVMLTTFLPWYFIN